MTPKDKLISELSVFLQDAFHAGFNAVNVSELHNFDGFAEAEEAVNNYAVGRWVSVEERLPEFDELGVWEGYARLNNEIKSIEAGQWDEGLLEHVTHWLELEMPGGVG